ncbi:MAG: hypothetical protein QXU48_05845 [Thermoplasmata archaeon]
MEEVYGWDLGELQDKLRKESKKIYKIYFPFGYLFYHSTMRSIYRQISSIHKELFNENGINQKISKIEKNIYKVKNTIKSSDEKSKKKLEEKLKKLNEQRKSKLKEKDEKNKEIEELKKKLEKRKEEFRKKIDEIDDSSNMTEYQIKEILKNSDELPNFCLELPAIGRNFYLFNSKDIRNNPYKATIYLQLLIQEKYDELHELKASLKKRRDELTYERYPDATVNPFLYSENDFLNIGYTKPHAAVDIEDSLRLNIPIYIPLLCFENAFEDYYGRNILFYTNNLKTCYSINKRTRLKKNLADNRKQESLLKITISSVIDEIIEQNTQFSLENMYIIEYAKVEHQKFVGVKYIGIPKLQATVILDDVVRNALNESIQYRVINDDKVKYKQYAWLLEEFMAGKQLYPIILAHIELALNDGKMIPRHTPSLYSLIINAKIIEFGYNYEINRVFSDNYFNNYKSIAKEIKNELVETSAKVSIFSSLISKDLEAKKRLARELFETIKGKNKNMFINILLRNMNEKEKVCTNHNFIEWVFHKIINNDISYEMYGLILILYLLRGEKR